ncbi:hypothetical protein V8E53_007501 [Lactarius tabidus]
MRQDLYDFVQHSSKRLKLCEADILQYHQQFLVLSNPLVRAHYLTVEEHDTEFWYGFHPDDCTELYPHLCRAVPRWPRDTPFDMNDVFTNAREIFMIKLPWLQKSHSEAPNTKHEPANLFEPVSVLTSLPPSTPPPPLAPTPHPSPERPPEIHRPTSAPPVTQLFNDLGEGDLCPQVDLGDLPRTCHGSDAHETPCTSPPSSISFSPLPSLTHLLSSPRSSSPSPFPQSPVCLSPLPCDLSHTPSPSPPLTILATTLPLPSPLVNQSSSQPMLPRSPALPTHLSSPYVPIPILSPSPLLSILAPLPSPLSVPDILPIILSPLDPVPTRLLPLPPDLSPVLSPSLSLVHAATSPPPSLPSLSLMLLSQPRSQLLDGLCSAPRDPPLPLVFPLSPPPRPPDSMPAHTVKPQPPSPAPSPSSAFPPQMFDCTLMPPHKCSPTTPPPSRAVPLLTHPSPHCDSSLTPLQSLLRPAHATSLSPAPNLLLAPPPLSLNSAPIAPRDGPLPLAFPPSLPPQPPDSTPASSAKPLTTCTRQLQKHDKDSAVPHPERLVSPRKTRRHHIRSWSQTKCRGRGDGKRGNFLLDEEEPDQEWSVFQPPGWCKGYTSRTIGCMNLHHQDHPFQVSPRPPTSPQHTTKPTVQSSWQTRSNLKITSTPSTGATANASASATTVTDTPLHNLVLESSPTATTGSLSRETQPSPFVPPTTQLLLQNQNQRRTVDRGQSIFRPPSRCKDYILTVLIDHILHIICVRVPVRLAA